MVVLNKALENEVLESLENTRGTEELQRVGREKIDALRNSIVEIEELIEGREDLSEEIIHEGEKVKMEINNMLMEKKTINSMDPNETIDPKEKTELRKKKIEITELQLNEKVSCWKDVALLKKEMRECQMELSEKEGRVNVLDKLLE